MFMQAFIQFPGLKSAAENQEYVITCMLDALNTLALLADEEDPSNNTFGFGKPVPGETIVAFKEFEVKFVIYMYSRCLVQAKSHADGWKWT